MRYWQTYGDFFKELRRDFRQTGAVLPSSRFLARALIKPLRQPRPPARILEVGAGTGAISAVILRHLRPDDKLDLVEINPRFVAILRRRLEEDWQFRRHGGQVRIVNSPIEELNEPARYDYIVSCLPLNNFPASQVRQIFQQFERLLAPGGTLTFFEYALLRQLKTPFVDRRERRRLYRVGRIVSSYVKDYQVKREQVFANFPPATVRHLRWQREDAELLVRPS
jgi:phospholipid N-methyltransferase